MGAASTLVVPRVPRAKRMSVLKTSRAYMKRKQNSLRQSISCARRRNLVAWVGALHAEFCYQVLREPAKRSWLAQLPTKLEYHFCLFPAQASRKSSSALVRLACADYLPKDESFRRVSSLSTRSMP